MRVSNEESLDEAFESAISMGPSSFGPRRRRRVEGLGQGGGRERDDEKRNKTPEKVYDKWCQRGLQRKDMESDR